MATEVNQTLAVVESFFGERLSDAVIDTARRLPHDQMLELAHRLHDAPKQVVGGEIHVSETTLFQAGRDTDLTAVADLPHISLYTRRVLARDPLTDFYAPTGSSSVGGVETVRFRHERNARRWRAALIDGLAQILDLAELIRQGALVLQPYHHSFAGWDENLIWNSNWSSGDFPTSDPYIRAFLADSGGAGSLDQLLKTFPGRPSGRDVSDALAFDLWINQFGWQPITSNPVVIHHQRTVARLHGGNRPALDSPLLGPAVGYRVPALTGVSLADIGRMRANEEVFADVREALVRLNVACVEASGVLGGPDHYLEYKNFVAEYADEIVRPTYEKLQRRHRKLLFLQRTRRTAARVITLGIDPLLGAVPGVGELIGGRVEKAFTRSVSRTRQQTEVACGILKTILRGAG
jgi:hypothetical protein